MSLLPVFDPISKSPALLAYPSPIVHSRVFWTEWVAALAVRLCSFLRGVRGYSFWKGRGVPKPFLGHGAFQRPAAFKPNSQGTQIDPMFFGNFCDMPFNAINQNHSFFTLVSGLLFVGRPSAIARFIVSVCVNAFNRHLERARPHILKEVVERMSPAVAHFDPAPSVVFVGNRIRVIASLLHRAERDIGALFRFVSHPASLGNNMAVSINPNVAGYNYVV